MNWYWFEVVVVVFLKILYDSVKQYQLNSLGNQRKKKGTPFSPATNVHVRRTNKEIKRIFTTKNDQSTRSMKKNNMIISLWNIF